MRIINSKEIGREAVERLLTKKSFDKVELSPKIREANKKIFGEDLSAVEIVRKIVSDVRNFGDKAVIDYTKKIDGVELENFAVEIPEINIEPEILASLKVAAENIRRFHVEQLPKSWITYRGENSLLGQAVIPLDRVFDEYYPRQSRGRSRNYHVHAQFKSLRPCRRQTRGC